MSDFLLLNEADIPTNRRSVLRGIIGKVITQLFRFSLDDFEEFKVLGIYKDIKRSEFFQKTAGPCVLVTSDGHNIGFSSDESINSILVWLEADGKNTNTDYVIFDDDEYTLLNAKDKEFTKPSINETINQTIRSVKILKRSPESAKHETLPNEVGLQLELENGQVLIMSHNLIQSSDSFAIAYRDEISPEILKELTEIEIK